MNKVVDCRGMVCPQPVLAAKDALAEIDEGVVEVLVDNEASRSNLERFGASQGCSVEVRREGEDFRVKLTKKSGATPAKDALPAEEYTCSPRGSSGIVYLIPSDTMGRGDDQLGRVLMRAFVKTIREVEPLPERIFFYNSGVRLTAEESDLVEPLRELAARGVGIFSCGTCLDYFHLKENLLVGEVTNMYEILAAMTSAAKVISPL